MPLRGRRCAQRRRWAWPRGRCASARRSVASHGDARPRGIVSPSPTAPTGHLGPVAGHRLGAGRGLLPGRVRAGGDPTPRQWPGRHHRSPAPHRHRYPPRRRPPPRTVARAGVRHCVARRHRRAGSVHGSPAGDRTPDVLGDGSLRPPPVAVPPRPGAGGTRHLGGDGVRRFSPCGRPHRELRGGRRGVVRRRQRPRQTRLHRRSRRAGGAAPTRGGGAGPTIAGRGAAPHRPGPPRRGGPQPQRHRSAVRRRSPRPLEPTRGGPEGAGGGPVDEPVCTGGAPPHAGRPAVRGVRRARDRAGTGHRGPRGSRRSGADRRHSRRAPHRRGGRGAAPDRGTVGVPDRPGGAHQCRQARRQCPGRGDRLPGGDAVTVDVVDDGGGPAPDAATRAPAPASRAPGIVGHHGIVGMRERAAVFGGWLDAGPRESGGFRVLARLPLGAPTT